MFKIDRNAPAPSAYLKTPGIYRGTIVFPKELECTPKGETKIRLEYITESGDKASDDFINSDKMHWKLNVLLAAVDPAGTKINVKDGADFDFTKDQNFINFLKQFDGHQLSFVGFTETYQKKDGSEGQAYRVRPLDPRKGRTQIPQKVLDQIKAAEIAAEGPDEVPF